MSKSMRLWLLLFALVGGLLIAAACGGSDDDDDDGEEPTAVETMEDGEEPTSDDDNGDGDILDELGDLGQREMKVTYEISSTTDGSVSTYVVYWKPPDQWRFDIESEDGGLSLIQTDGTVYSCTGSEGEGTCFASPGGTSSIPIPFLSSLTTEGGLGQFIGAAFAGVDVDTSSETIAGRDATCYRVSGSAEGESGFVEVCEADGVVLRWQGGGGGEGGKIEATEVEDTVSDADLELPYPVQEIPGLP